MTKFENMNRAEKLISLLNIENRKKINKNLNKTIQNYREGTKNADLMLDTLFEQLRLNELDKQARLELQNELLYVIKNAAGYHQTSDYMWNVGGKLAPLQEITQNESKKHWKGKTDKGRKVAMGQQKNGMYYGEIRDEYGDIESASTAKTKQEIDRWFDEHGIKRIKWDLKETTITGADIVGKDSNLQGDIYTRKKSSDGLHRQEPKKRKYDEDELDVDKKLQQLKKLFNDRNKTKITMSALRKILTSESIEQRSKIKHKMLAASALISEDKDCEKDLLRYYFTDGFILDESSGGSSSSTTWSNWHDVSYIVYIDATGRVKSSNSFLARVSERIDQQKLEYLLSKGITVITLDDQGQETEIKSKPSWLKQ